MRIGNYIDFCVFVLVDDDGDGVIDEDLVNLLRSNVNVLYIYYCKVKVFKID